MRLTEEKAAEVSDDGDDDDYSNDEMEDIDDDNDEDHHVENTKVVKSKSLNLVKIEILLHSR